VSANSTIIEDIKIRKSGLASLAISYYDFREEQKKDLRGLLTSVLLVVELAHTLTSSPNSTRSTKMIHKTPAMANLSSIYRNYWNCQDSLSDYRCLGRISKHIRIAVPPRESPIACGTAYEVTTHESAHLCHQLTRDQDQALNFPFRFHP